MQQIPITILDGIESVNIPSIPHVLLRFLIEVEEDRSSFGELATLVGQDPVLSARFLTVANSAAMCRKSKAINLEQCMVTLGTGLARTIATCLVVQSVFTRATNEKQYDVSGFWKHSLKVAEISRIIATKMNYIDTEEAYLTGLIHDIGLLLLLGSVGESYGDALRWSIDESTLNEIEKPMIGTDHSAVGAWLVNKWELPSFMSDAILFHHKSADEIVDADQLSQIIWGSHIIGNYSEKSDLTQMGDKPDLAAAMSIFKIGINEVTSICDQASERVAVLAVALGVAESTNARMLPSPVIPFETSGPCRQNKDPAYLHMDEMVRDMALLQSLQQNMSLLCSEEDLLIAVKECAKILFGLDWIAFLLLDQAKSTLSGANFLGQSAVLQRLEIRLDPVSSLVAAVALGELPYSTFDKDRPGAVTLVDVQIAHLLNSEGLLYVPMRINDKLIGVMAYGFSVLQQFKVQQRLDWMTSFARLAAISIDALRNMRSNEEKVEGNAASRFKLQASRIVHEAGNPLSIIKNYLKIVTQKLSTQNDVRQELDILCEEIDRVSHILQGLNSLDHTLPTTDIVDINSVIEGMLLLYGGSIFSVCGITFKKMLDPSIPLITGNRDKIKQILLNIWKNAAEAMSSGGLITISTVGNVIRNGCNFVEIIISDTGPGLPADVKLHLFKPLEQNRRPGHAGIGLSIVASLVESLEGVITCHSNSGMGTTFSILLPLTRENKR